MGTNGSKCLPKAAFYGEERKGETRPVRHWKAAQTKNLPRTTIPGIDTMLKAFENTREKMGSMPFLGTREKLTDNKYGKYLWKTYDEVYALTQNLAQGIEECDLSNPIEDLNRSLRFIGIYSPTREEWLMTDIACWHISVTSVPLYTTMSDSDIVWIFQQTKLKSIFLSGNVVERIIKIKEKGLIPSLKNLIIYDELSENSEFPANAKKEGITIYDFKKLLETQSAHKFHPAEPDSLMSICYTSGTTGNPKGAEITHSQVLAASSTVKEQEFVKTYPGMTYLAFLPLAHMCERSMEYISIFEGWKIGYYHGDFTQLPSDMQELKPHVIVGVPRIYNRVHDKMVEVINNMTGFKKWFINYALKIKQTKYSQKNEIEHALYDKLIFNKFSAILGGKCKFIICAAAPIESKVVDFLRILLSCPISLGYGLTESLGAVMASYPGDHIPGSTGVPFMASEIKLIDVPDMQYFVTDRIEGALRPRGEICIRGTSIMTRYFQEEKLTRQTIDSEGWLHTGDVGELILEAMVFKIIDRKKNLFKLQQGEYLSPEKLENIYLKSQFVQQIFVHGESTKTYPIAIIVPNKRKILREIGIDSSSLPLTEEQVAEKYKSREIQNIVLKDLEKIARNDKLAGFEFIKGLHLTIIPFLESEGTLTPTFKLKRHAIRNKYSKEIAEVYRLL